MPWADCATISTVAKAIVQNNFTFVSQSLRYSQSNRSLSDTAASVNNDWFRRSIQNRVDEIIFLLSREQSVCFFDKTGRREKVLFVGLQSAKYVFPSDGRISRAFG